METMGIGSAIGFMRLLWRNRGITLLTFVLGCTISFPVPPAAASSHSTVYVGDEVAIGGGGSCASPDLSTLDAADNIAIQTAISLVSADDDDELDTVYLCPGTFTLTATLEAASAIRLTGASAATTILDGAGIHQILVLMNEGADVSNITFLNGSTGDLDGGAIYASGDLNVSGAVFQGNASDGVGGAIAAYGTVTVNASTFDENTALIDGGAIWAPTVVVTASTFSDNSAGSLGGAIFASEFVTTTDSDFYDNYSDFGGALYSFDQVSLDGGELKRNTVTGDGGAIWGEEVSIESVVLEDNCAVSGGAAFAVNVLYSTTSRIAGNCGSAPSFSLEVTIVRRGIVLNNGGFPTCTVGVCTNEYSANTILTGDPTSVEWSATVAGSMHDAVCELERCTVSRAIEAGTLVDLGSTFIEELAYQITATFPVRARHSVDVQVLAGLGTVTDGSSLVCNEFNPSSCSAEYDEGTTVHLIATPGEGFEVGSWVGEGAASCSGDQCTFASLSSPRSVSVVFKVTDRDGGGGGGGAQRVRLSIEPPRFGLVEVVDLLTMSGRECRPEAERCEYRYRVSRVLTLFMRDLPAGASFRWNGCSEQTANSCTVVMSQDQEIRVRIRQEWTSFFKRGQPVFRDGALAYVKEFASSLLEHGKGERILIMGYAKKRLSLARSRARALKRALREFGLMSPIGFDYAIALPSERKARAVLSVVWNGRG